MDDTNHPHTGSASQSPYPLYPSAVLVPVLACISIIVDIPPFLWHVRHRNIGACGLIFWLLILNIMNFTNALLWPTDDIAGWWKGRGFCDVEVRLSVGALVALPGALACIMRQLSHVMDTKNIVLVQSRAQRRRQYVLDLLLCFGCPLFFTLVYYVVQDKRYYIWAISGCNWSIDNSWVGVVLVFIWPPILSLVDAYYATLVVVRLYRYRQEFSCLLQASKTTKSRFLRLFIMSMVLILGILPVQFYILFRNVRDIHPGYSWSEVHAQPDWNIAVMVPAGGVVRFDRWICIACGFLVFMFFGIGTDAVTMYRSWLAKLNFAKASPNLERHIVRQRSTHSGISGSIGNKAKVFFRKLFYRVADVEWIYQGSVLESVSSSPTARKVSFFRWTSNASLPSSFELPTRERPSDRRCSPRRLFPFSKPSKQGARSQTQPSILARNELLEKETN